MRQLARGGQARGYVINFESIAYAELVVWLEELGWDRWEAYEALTQIGQLTVGNMVDTYYSMVAKVDKTFALAGAERD